MACYLAGKKKKVFDYCKRDPDFFVVVFNFY